VNLSELQILKSRISVRIQNSGVPEHAHDFEITLYSDSQPIKKSYQNFHINFERGIEIRCKKRLLLFPNISSASKNISFYT